jgi:L-serine deaminase
MSLNKVADLSRDCIAKLQHTIVEFHETHEETETQRVIGSAIISSMFNVIVVFSLAFGLTPQQMHNALAGCIAHNMGEGETRQ